MVCTLSLRSRATAARRQINSLQPLVVVRCRVNCSSTPQMGASQRDAGEQHHRQHQGEEEFTGLLPEEDVEVPGTYMDAMNSNTKLGKAVRAAVEELEHLGDLETDVLQQCDDLLKKLGMKGSIFGRNSPAQLQQQQALDGEDSSSHSS